jgi:hypothetical protein
MARVSWEEYEERSDRNEDEAQRGEPPMSITRLRHVEDCFEPHASHTLQLAAAGDRQRFRP